MRIYIIVSILFLLAACKPSNVVNGSSATAITNTTVPDYCASFDIAFNGVFSDGFSEGTMTWKGGTEGTLEISGIDYNEMTCTYKVTNCELGQISMICNQSGYDTTVDLYTADSIRLGTTIYTRVK